MSTKKTSPDVSFEDAMKQLEATVLKLESPDIPLDDAVKMYREAYKLLTECRERLEQAKYEISIIRE